VAIRASIDLAGLFDGDSADLRFFSTNEQRLASASNA
jgi:hypothetical protein